MREESCDALGSPRPERAGSRLGFPARQPDIGFPGGSVKAEDAEERVRVRDIAEILADNLAAANK